MNWSATAAALLLAAAPVAAQQSQTDSRQPAPAAADGQVLTLQGCVKAGVEKDTVLMTDVTETMTAGRSAVPTEAHGRKVIFWLDKDDALMPHVGHMVQVTGRSSGIQKSEIELKPGPQKDGGLVVEFEGPGKDVKASAADAGAALGTSGRTTAEKNDLQTFLFKVAVDDVKPVSGTCR
jgi:uncharacterized cupredoxin-like copper-binding protein